MQQYLIFPQCTNFKNFWKFFKKIFKSRPIKQKITLFHLKWIYNKVHDDKISDGNNHNPYSSLLRHNGDKRKSTFKFKIQMGGDF